MLGKTNINTLSEGTIVTEIEDYRWIQMQSGVFSDFVKAIYKNNYLVAITADGKIVYTTDGEVWTTVALEYVDCKLYDIDFDGSRFILAGSYMRTETLSGGSTRKEQKGLIVVTSDFVSYEKKEITGKNDYNTCLAVYPKNGKYIVLNGCFSLSKAIYILIGDLSGDTWEKETLMKEINMENPFSVAKNSSYILIAGMRDTNTSSSSYMPAVVAIQGNNPIERLMTGGEANVFECKDELYYMSSSSLYEYKFAKLLSSGEEMIVSSDINFMFTDGVYFNECKIFINAHEMLIVKKGENIADKTLDDLIEIAPEFTINCITKAFGQLYVFGNQGVILKSSVEANNEEAIAVQTLSAKKALVEAKVYADERYAALEARIEDLEKLKET